MFGSNHLHIVQGEKQRKNKQTYVYCEKENFSFWIIRRYSEGCGFVEKNSKNCVYCLLMTKRKKRNPIAKYFTSRPLNVLVRLPTQSVIGRAESLSSDIYILSYRSTFTARIFRDRYAAFWMRWRFLIYVF